MKKISRFTILNLSSFIDASCLYSTRKGGSRWLYFCRWGCRSCALRLHLWRKNLGLSGWETSFAKLSIGTVMNALTFKWAIEERGLREYDFGVEVSRYKTEWADCSRDIIDFTVPNPHSKAAWFSSRPAPSSSSQGRPYQDCLLSEKWSFLNFRSSGVCCRFRSVCGGSSTQRREDFRRRNLPSGRLILGFPRLDHFDCGFDITIGDLRAAIHIDQ